MYMQTMVDSRQLTQVHWKNGHKMGPVHIFLSRIEQNAKCHSY